MEAREIQQTKAKNDLDDMHAAATKLAHAHKKICVRRSLTQVRPAPGCPIAVLAQADSESGSEVRHHV